MQQYVDLVNRVLREGEPRADRTGVGTLAVFGGRIEFDLRERFPLVTVKETRWKTAFLEMLWFLRGETNTKYLNRHGCTLWDAWADGRGNLGPVYGVQWRRWDVPTDYYADEAESVDQIAVLIDGLKTAVAEHQKWLDETLVPNAKGEFRVGAEVYDQKLQFALLSSLSRAEIKQRAEAELVRVRGEMYAIAQQVLKDTAGAPELPDNPSPQQQQKAIEAALELAYAQHPARDQVVADARVALDRATAFVREHDLVTVPDAPVEIIEMPEFQRGVAVAYADSPGPLDKNLKTFYAVSPMPEDWTDAQVESFLREYNSRMIDLLSIHEGTPGHYLEGWHSAKFPSTLRAVLRSGMFAEGWAVYTEDMMADAGYMDNDPLFRLVQQKFYLRTIANALLDQGVHVDNWTREQAMDLMVKQTFQQEREAAGKWTRAQLTSAQLPTYFVGVQEHFDTRKAVEEKLGDKFNLKAYHDQVLSYGAPPVRFVRELMLDQQIQ